MGERGTGEEQAGRVRGRFARGTSGNPKGRPRGSRNRTSQLCADLLGESAEDIIATVIKRAKKGDAIALRLCVERLVPIRAARDRAVEVALPAAESAVDLVHAAAVVIDGAASGEMTLSEAHEFMRLLELQRRAIETSELVMRIEALESSGEGAAAPEAGRVRRVVDDDGVVPAAPELGERVRVMLNRRLRGES
jgi:hypothetical protein